MFFLGTYEIFYTSASPPAAARHARGPSSCGSRAEGLAKGHLVPRAWCLGSKSSTPKPQEALILRHDRRSRAQKHPLRRRRPKPGVGKADKDAV